MSVSSRLGRGWTARTLLVGVAALAVTLVAGTAAEAGPDTVSATAQPGPTFNGQVFAVAYDGGTVYVGGDFTTATAGGHASARSHLAALDATTGALLPWSPGADGEVRTLAITNGVVYLGGSFQHVAGAARGGLAAVTTGGALTSFAHTVNGLPRAMAVSGSRLYVGGQFTSVDGQSRGHLAAFELPGGTLSTAWRPSANSRVDALATFGSQVFVGGSFNQVNGAGPAHLAALDTGDGHTLGFRGTARYEVFGVFADATGVYAALDGPGGHAVAYTASGSTRWTLTTDGNAQAVAVLQNTVYVGGHFASVCRTAATGTQGTCLGGRTDVGKIFAVNLSGVLQDWRPSVRGVHGVQQIAVNAGLHMIAIGGDFSTVGGSSRRDFAQFH
jgi:hypothetical protein